MRQVRDEGQKVTWTSRNETLVSTIMVLIMVAIASVFFFLVDQILRWIVPIILNLNF
ncbi:MAG: preprotein translocase subunit SecE [Pseudomonadota bacterium]